MFSDTHTNIHNNSRLVEWRIIFYLVRWNNNTTSEKISVKIHLPSMRPWRWSKEWGMNEPWLWWWNVNRRCDFHICVTFGRSSVSEDFANFPNHFCFASPLIVRTADDLFSVSFRISSVQRWRTNIHDSSSESAAYGSVPLHCLEWCSANRQ